MIASEFNGRRILHVDSGGLQHTGIVVGETDNGKQVYVQSDLPTMPALEWHFTVSKALLPILLSNAETFLKA